MSHRSPEYGAVHEVPAGSTVGYVRSGAWGKAAHADATRAASTYLAWDGQDSGFTRMPQPQTPPLADRA